MSSTELRELPPDRNSRKSSKSEHANDDLDEEARVCFIQPDKQKASPKVIEFNGLSKEELMKFQNDPFWKKVRLVLFILFWIIWASMIIAAVLIIYFTPKCPPIPKKSFWQKSSGYILDVPTFKDSNGDGIGDLKGVIEKMDYLESKGGYLIIKSVLKGSLGTKTMRVPSVTNFKEIDERIGSLDDVKKLIKICNKKQMKVLLEFSFNSGKYHPWFMTASKGDKKFQGYYLWSSAAPSSDMVNRVGKSVWNKIGTAGNYWSSLDESLPALNVNDTNLQAALKDAVQFWLKQGFSGIFVDDVAFLAPDVKSKDVGKGKDVSKITSGELKKWYGAGHNGQLLTDDAVEFVKKVRSWVDEIRNQAGRELFLLVSPGNTGLKHSHNQTMSLLGSPSEPGAHSVVLFNLVPFQGEKVITSKSSYGVKQSIDAAFTSGSDRVVLMTQTISGPRVDKATMTYMNLLLPSSALSVYGEEIGMKGYGKKLKETKTVLPYSFITKAALINQNDYIDDLVDTYNVPMQWTQNGGFSPNITYKSAENVMSMSTLGREMTRYKVFMALVKLRKEPSLNWGKMDWIDSREKTSEPDYFIFTRTAKGFPKYLIVLIGPAKVEGGLDRDMSGVCAEANIKLSYPRNQEFVSDKKLPMKNIFFRYSKDGSIYVFQCA